MLSWFSATVSYYFLSFSHGLISEWRLHGHVIGATVSAERSIEFRLLGFYTLWFDTESVRSAI